MFVVHNTTSHRVTLKLLPATSAADGTPSWAKKRFVRQHTFHAVVEPHLSMDLTVYGYTEEELLRQPDVLLYLSRGYLRRVLDGGGGYAENQFSAHPTHPMVVPTVPDPDPDPDPEPEPEPEPDPDPDPDPDPEFGNEASTRPEYEPLVVTIPDSELPPGKPVKRTPVRLPKKR